MSPRRGLQKTLAALVFAAAAACFAVGVAGRGGPLATMASLALLTIGFGMTLHDRPR